MAGLEETIVKLEAYCRDRQWAGYDPYDALNSELFARSPLMKSHVARLAFTQFLKRSPVNLRPWLRIEPRQDPKAIALFLMAYVRRARTGDEASRATAIQLANRLLELRSPGTGYSCWGYSFPWQMRHRLVPRFGPNLVGTTFAANALLDAYDAGLGSEFLGPAVSAGEYLAKELYWHDGQQAGFAYPLPDIRVPIHNANFLGAALLCRLARLTGEKAGVDAALGAARYSARSQREDGSWAYGVGPTQQWADNFHTGYNLCALQSIGADLGTDEFEPVLAKGFAFYREHFFTAERRAQVLPRPDVPDRHPLGRAEPHHAHGVPRARPGRGRRSPGPFSRGRWSTCGTSAASSTTACCGPEPSGPRTCDGPRRGCCWH